MDEFQKVDRDIDSEKQKTQLKKEKFIKDIKSGLGTHIKYHGGKENKVTFYKKIYIIVLNI